MGEVYRAQRVHAFAREIIVGGLLGTKPESTSRHPKAIIWMGGTTVRQMWKRLLDPNGPRLFFGVLCKPFKRMAGTTGLEPAASAVTG
jgi:hypothetical protein